MVPATACAIWYGDVMHGPHVPVKGKLAKSYLVSLFDDASRLTYVEVLSSEQKRTAIAFSGVVVRRLLTDNGNAYRSHLFAAACHELGMSSGLIHPKNRPRARMHVAGTNRASRQERVKGTC